MQTIGERLEEARKRKGISIREAAEATKIRSDYLHKLESNSFDLNLPEIYIRGFLRNYANYLKLNCDKMLADYKTLAPNDGRGSRRDNREIYGRMERMAATLVTMVTEAALDAGLQVTANRVGSMFTWFFTPEIVTDWLAAATCNTKAFGRFHHGMLDAGVYLPPSQFEAAFLGAAHTDEDISQTVAAAREALTGVHV